MKTLKRYCQINTAINEHIYEIELIRSVIQMPVSLNQMYRNYIIFVNNYLSNVSDVLLRY